MTKFLFCIALKLFLSKQQPVDRTVADDQCAEVDGDLIDIVRETSSDDGSSYVESSESSEDDDNTNRSRPPR